MDFESMLGRTMALLPSDWSDGTRMAVVAAAVFVCFVVPVVMLLTAFGKKRAPATVSGRVAAPVAGQTGARAAPLVAAVSDLDPDEWLSGNVIHYDRQKSFGFIRCDRVKGHVRFQAPDFRRAPRIGETVRFKGRHGARRKPVAVVVERVPGEKRAV